MYGVGPMMLLRRGLLDGRGIVLAGGVADGIATALSELGARVEMLQSVDEAEAGEWARGHAPLHAVVYDAGPSFGAGGPEALTRTLHDAWLAVREVAVGALIEGSEPGKVVLIGPAADAGRHAQAARAALENLARTLSVEWARYGVTTVMVAPGPELDGDRLAELVAFLCSPAADYVSGSRLDFG